MASIHVDGNDIYFRSRGGQIAAAHLDEQQDGSVQLWIQGRVVGGRISHHIETFKDMDAARRDATSCKTLHTIFQLWLDRMSQHEPRTMTNALVYDGRTYRHFRVTPKRNGVILTFYNRDDPKVKMLGINLDVDDAKRLVLLVNQALSGVVITRLANRFFHDPEVQEILNKNPRTRQMMNDYLGSLE